jgi:hypothetical protein
MRTVDMKDEDLNSLRVDQSRLVSVLHETCKYGAKHRWGE